MQLFYIAYTLDDGEATSADLFVTAPTSTRAVELWRDWVRNTLGTETGEPSVFIVPHMLPAEGTHEWHTGTPHGVPEVAY